MDIPTAYQWVVENYPILTRTEEIELFKQLEDADPLVVKKARDTIFYSNLRLVFKVAGNFKNRRYTLELDDLISEGIFGLDRAIEKFDYTLGYKFSTYAISWLRSFIDRRGNLQSDLIRKPCHVRQEYLRIKKFIKQYSLNNEGVIPDYPAIASELELSIDKIRLILSSMRRESSLNTPLITKDGENTQLLDLITDNKVITPDEVAQQNSITERLDELLNILESRDREIVILYYTSSVN